MRNASSDEPEIASIGTSLTKMTLSRLAEPEGPSLHALIVDAKEALRESEERYRMLLDGIQNYAIFMMDRRGQVISWNAGAQRIKGYTADEIIGRNFSCFFPPRDVEQGRPEEVRRLTAAVGRHEEQGMRVRKDGSQFLASVTFTALRDPAGNLRGFSEFSHDLSESNCHFQRSSRCRARRDRPARAAGLSSRL